MEQITGTGRWALLDRWFVFIAGQVNDRQIFRWIYENRRLIFTLWAWAAVICSAWYLNYFFAKDEHGHSGFFLLGFELLLSLVGLESLSKISLFFMCLSLGAITPVIAVLVPFGVILAPLFMAGLALWVVFGFASLIVLALAPAGLIIGARAMFIHYFARWLAEADQRAFEKHAVFTALGLGGGASRTIDGRARMMDEDEVAAYEGRGAPILLGTYDGEEVFARTEKHVTIVAGSRGGKGRDLIVPNLKLYEGSVFVLDPKGENASLTADARAAFGAVHVLDPFGVSGRTSATFNPVALLRGDGAITAAQMLADALIVGKDGDFWAGSARELVTALLLHIATAEDMAHRDLPMLRHLLMVDLTGTLEKMIENDAAPALVRDVAESALGADNKMWSSVVWTAVEQTKWLSSPEMQRVLADSVDAVDFDRYLTEVQSVYVCLPAPYFRTFNRWLRLVVAAAIDAMTKRLAPPPLPVRFVLDEVAQLGNLEKIESALTLSAGYGVQLWGVWQHIGSIKQCYPQSGVGGWASSSGVRLCFSTNDNETCEEFSKQAGGIIQPDRIARMGELEMLVLLDRQNPLIVQRLGGV